MINQITLKKSTLEKNARHGSHFGQDFIVRDSGMQMGIELNLPPQPKLRRVPGCFLIIDNKENGTVQVGPGVINPIPLSNPWEDLDRQKYVYLKVTWKTVDDVVVGILEVEAMTSDDVQTYDPDTDNFFFYYLGEKGDEDHDFYVQPEDQRRCLFLRFLTSLSCGQYITTADIYVIPSVSP